MTYYAPPPPPPAPSGTAWWRTPTALFLIGVLVAAAVAVPVVLLVLGGGEEGSASGSSTTAATTSSAPPTTAEPSTTAATTTSTTSPTTTSSAATTTTTAAGTALNPNLDAFFADFDLAGGFTPDPWESEAQSGGPVDTSYLGGDCAGFASEAPDFRINYTGGDSSIRFYFIADDPADDTTLIVYDPDSNWVCGDDSYSTFHPTVDFLGIAPNGIYEIWIGSYSPEEYVTGIFYITELDANHP